MDSYRLKINKKFASSYKKKKEQEELSQRKLSINYLAAKAWRFDVVRDKYGEDVDSSSSEEDEEAEGLTSDVERDFLRTLSLLKSKDPSIYDSHSEFYSHGMCHVVYSWSGHLLFPLW